MLGPDKAFAWRGCEGACLGVTLRAPGLCARGLLLPCLRETGRELNRRRKSAMRGELGSASQHLVHAAEAEWKIGVLGSLRHLVKDHSEGPERFTGRKHWFVGWVQPDDHCIASWLQQIHCRSLDKLVVAKEKTRRLNKGVNLVSEKTVRQPDLWPRWIERFTARLSMPLTYVRLHWGQHRHCICASERG